MAGLSSCGRTPSPGIRYQNLGKSGLRISNIGLATWMLDSSQSENVVTLAYDSGINVFDLSEAYSGPAAEIELGKILKKKGWKRTTYNVITKIYWTSTCEERCLSRKYILGCAKSSLERLQLDYIDVILLHRVDPTCPIEEIVRAMGQLVSTGLAMYWGTSKWSPTEIMDGYSTCRQFNCATPIVEQAEYHFFCREKAELSMKDVFNKNGVGLMTWSPLTMNFYKAMGKNTEESLLLSFHASMKKKTGPNSWNEDEVQGREAPRKSKKQSMAVELRKQQQHQRQSVCPDIVDFADKSGCTLAQLAIAWCLKNETVQCMLVGPTNAQELTEYLKGLQLIPVLNNNNVITDLEKILDSRPAKPQTSHEIKQ